MDIKVDVNILDLDSACFLAEQVTIAYINGLNVGQEVILAEIIDAVMGVSGVLDVVIHSPVGNIPILHDHVAVANNILVS